MKKHFILFSLLSVAALFTACKKDYTCECTVDTGKMTEKAQNVISDSRRSEAKAECDRGESRAGIYGGIEITVECELL